MKKVLLFDTALATSNIGDEIIFESAKEALDPIIRDAAIYRMGTHVVNYSAFQMFVHKFIRPDSKIRAICDKADYKFICGTNLLMDDLISPRPQFMLNYANKSLYYNAVMVGVGRVSDYNSFKNSYTVGLYRKVFSGRYLHSVRDEETKNVLKTIGIDSINTGCPTLWMLTKERCAEIPRVKARNAVFSLSGYRQQSDPASDMKMVECILRNYDKVYAWIQTACDEEYVRKILNGRGNVKFVYSLDRFAEILKCGDIDYIGTRLHGAVFAMQHGVRSLVIAVDERARGFHESNNLPILEREKIELLESVIKAEIVTDIRIKEKEIRDFLGQFV